MLRLLPLLQQPMPRLRRRRSKDDFGGGLQVYEPSSEHLAITYDV
jgi:hypothetical protein